MEILNRPVATVIYVLAVLCSQAYEIRIRIQICKMLVDNFYVESTKTRLPHLAFVNFYVHLLFYFSVGPNGTGNQAVTHDPIDVRECCVLDAGGLC